MRYATPGDRPQSALFYGWRIVGVCFLTLFVSVGFSFYSFGAFFKAIAAEFGSSRLGVGGGLAVFTLTSGLIAPFLGRWISHRPIRNIMTGGVVVLAAGFLLISRAASLSQLYLVLATMMAVGASVIGGLTASTLVANWFVRQRGMALGVATMGISLSGVVMAPAATLLIARYGWRTTFVIYAALTLVTVLPAVRWVVVNQPEDLGLHPDGDASEPSDQLETQRHGSAYTWHQALRDRNFWVIALAVSLNMCANGAVLTHIIPHATDLGFSATLAALVLSCIALLGVVGKVLFGWIADRVDKRAAMWLSSGLQAVAVVVFLGDSSYPSLLIGGAIFGLGMGGLVPLWGTLIGASFGRRVFGRVMGLMTPFMLPLQTSGVPLAGYLFDRTGSYAPAFRLFIALYVLAIAVLAMLRLPKREPPKTALRAAPRPTAASPPLDHRRRLP